MSAALIRCRAMHGRIHHPCGTCMDYYAAPKAKRLWWIHEPKPFRPISH